MIVKLNESAALKAAALPLGAKFTLSIKDGKRRRLRTTRIISQSSSWCDDCACQHHTVVLATQGSTMTLES